MLALILHDQLDARHYVLVSQYSLSLCNNLNTERLTDSGKQAPKHVLIAAGGLLITSPDVLLSGTLISNSFKCPRASVIQERFGGSGGYHAMKGTLLHELFQVGCAFLSLSLLGWPSLQSAPFSAGCLLLPEHSSAGSTLMMIG